MKNAIIALLHSRKFLLLLFALITNIIFYLIPNFPQTIWVSLDAVIIAVITSIAIEDAAEKRNS